MPVCWPASSSSSTPTWDTRGDFDLELLDERPGLIVFRADGRGAAALFAGEVGGHRWQRIPPTEKRGRVHSSTITVAVLPVPTEAELVISKSDLVWSTCRPSGKGGQAVQKTDSAVQLTHRPTGIQVRCESGRSQHHHRVVVAPFESRTALSLTTSPAAPGACATTSGAAGNRSARPAPRRF